jgi:hypothetical protein
MKNKTPGESVLKELGSMPVFSKDMKQELTEFLLVKE